MINERRARTTCSMKERNDSAQKPRRAYCKRKRKTLLNKGENQRMKSETGLERMKHDR